MVALNAKDTTGPTPGIVIKRRHTPSSRTIDKQFAVERREHFAQLLPGGQQRLHDGDEFGHAFDKLPNPFVELANPNDADLETEVAQQAADVVLNGDRLVLENLAGGQQSAALLAGQRLHVHGAEQIDPHHLRNAARVVHGRSC